MSRSGRSTPASETTIPSAPRSPRHYSPPPGTSLWSAFIQWVRSLCTTGQHTRHASTPPTPRNRLRKAPPPRPQPPRPTPQPPPQQPSQPRQPKHHYVRESLTAVNLATLSPPSPRRTSLFSDDGQSNHASSIFGLRSEIRTFATEAETRFLTLVEQEILAALQHVKLSPRQKSFMPDPRVLTLPDADSVTALQYERELTRTLPDEEKEAVCSDLARLLKTQRRVLLRRVIFEDVEVRISVEEGRVRPSPERHVTFGEAPAGKRRPRLRGGAGPARPKDDERPHSLLWWIAGGRVGNRRRPPAGAELRKRRVAEMERRQTVGFWGTVFNVRAPAEEAKAETVTPPAETAAAGSLPKDNAEGAASGTGAVVA